MYHQTQALLRITHKMYFPPIFGYEDYKDYEVKVVGRSASKAGIVPSNAGIVPSNADGAVTKALASATLGWETAPLAPNYRRKLEPRKTR